MWTSRRGLLGAASVAAASLVAGTRGVFAGNKQLAFSDMNKGKGTACLYHCDFGDQQRFAQVLNNITNHFGAYDNDRNKVKIVLVTHSAGIKFFLTDLNDTPWANETLDPALYNRFVELTKHGLEAYLCQITFKRLKVDPAKARVEPFLSFVPSGVATVAELQKKGFAYLKVG
jgi:intracellular sulfur oxidation DsrE/DsrF family protein